MKTSVADIKNVYVDPTNNLGIVQHTLGNVQSNETYNDGSILFHPPGFISKPVGPGTFSSTTPPVFQSSVTSPLSAKALAIENGNLWHVIGIVDVRSAQLITCPDGGAVMYAEGAPSSQILIDMNGNVTMTNGMSTVQINQNNDINLVVASGQMINLGSSSPVDSAALASKTDTNFTTISTAAETAVEAIMSTPPVTVPALAAILLTFLQTLTFNPVDSMVVKISG